VRVLGIDLGTRRIGLAVSDASGVLARPWKTLQAPAAAADRVQSVISAMREFAASEHLEAGADLSAAFAALVVGFPQRLGGGDTHLSGDVRAFAAALGAATGLAVHLQDERLSSHEAETRLGEHERDWRKRKVKLDAAAAAVILQDYLDTRADQRRPSAATLES
jgi:putative Holliday junction resolvase